MHKCLSVFVFCKDVRWIWHNCDWDFLWESCSEWIRKLREVEDKNKHRVKIVLQRDDSNECNE